MLSGHPANRFRVISLIKIWVMCPNGQVRGINVRDMRLPGWMNLTA